MGLSAIVFPGQGSQSVGMGRDLAEAYPAARAVYERADEVLGLDLASLCFEGPAEKLEQTDIQQPAIFVTSVAIWAAFVDSGGSLDMFSRSGGLSLGEYTAYHVTGAVGFEDALRLVYRRGQLMQEASTMSPSGMVSLIGADEEQAVSICEKARGGEVLTPANFNCPGQIVISGSRGACERALRAAEESGCRGVALPVAGAFHSALMEPAAEGLRPVLNEASFTEPAIPVIANVNASYHSDATAIRDSLYQQMTRPVLWQKCIERMMADGIERFVEVGPGRVLTGLMRKIGRKIPAVSVSSVDSIASVLAAGAVS